MTECFKMMDGDQRTRRRRFRMNIGLGASADLSVVSVISVVKCICVRLCFVVPHGGALPVP